MKGFCVLFGALVSSCLVALVLGHGRMMDPAARNACWRFREFEGKCPSHYTDNELNCGGFNVQWATNNGKCGVCGDPYHEKEQKHVYPGEYAKKGVITKTYSQGQEITVLVELTSNHMGRFKFTIGKLNKLPITKEQLTHVLRTPEGNIWWSVPDRSNSMFSIKLRLPAGLVCSRCVLQWYYKTGNSWGCDQEGCGLGYGKQETFVNCADVRIVSKDGTVPTDPPTQPPPPTTQRPVVATTTPMPTNAPNPGGCKAIGGHAGSSAMDMWCQKNCAIGYCPTSICKCWSMHVAVDAWYWAASFRSSIQ